MPGAVTGLRSERGDGLIEGILMIAVVLLTVAIGIQALLYAHARSVATGAAQDGARAAASAGADAGTARARTVLDASGGTADRLRPSASAGAGAVTVRVEGRAPEVFPLPGSLTDVTATATLPVERYPVAERAP
jgi:hypothetical protein